MATVTRRSVGEHGNGGFSSVREPFVVLGLWNELSSHQLACRCGGGGGGGGQKLMIQAEYR